MYIEKQFFLPRFVFWLKGLCLGLIVSQVTCLFITEIGWMSLWWSLPQHLTVLVLACLAFVFLSKLSFNLRITEGGIAIQSWQLSVHQQHINWSEVKNLKLLSASDLQFYVFWGIPNANTTHVFLLTNRRYKVFFIELLNGQKFFISTKKPDELLHFLQYEARLFSLRGSHDALARLENS